MSAPKPVYVFNLVTYKPSFREKIRDSKVINWGLVFFTLLSGGMIALGGGYSLPALSWVGICGLGLEVLMIGGVIYIRNKKKCSFTISSHNVGTDGDCSNKDYHCDIEKQDLTSKEKRKKVREARRTQFTKDTHADILCMQETFATFDETALSQALPKYRFLQAPGSEHAIDNDADTLIGWNHEKFGLLGHGHIKFSSPKGGQLNTKVVLLCHRQSGKKLLVASAHIEGFNIGKKQNVHQLSEHEAARLGDELRIGDQQLTGVVSVLDNLQKVHQANAVMIGMDANSDSQTHESRFSSLLSSSYISDQSLLPTFKDVSTQEHMKFDHIVFKLDKGGEIQPIGTPPLSSHYVKDSYGDHSKVIKDIRVF